MTANDKPRNEEYNFTALGIGIALGAGIGTALGAGIGAATGNMGMWIGIGAGLGPTFGMVIAILFKK